MCTRGFLFGTNTTAKRRRRRWGTSAVSTLSGARSAVCAGRVRYISREMTARRLFSGRIPLILGSDPAAGGRGPGRVFEIRTGAAWFGAFECEDASQGRVYVLCAQITVHDAREQRTRRVSYRPGQMNAKARVSLPLPAIHPPPRRRSTRPRQTGRTTRERPAFNECESPGPD